MKPLRLLSAFLTVVAAAAPLPAQDWTDRAEYDIVLAIRGAPTRESQLALIGEWKKKYPASALARSRAELELAVAESLGETKVVAAAARELVASGADNFVGLYWLTALAPSLEDQSPAALSQLEAAARRLLEVKDAFFSSASYAGAASGAAPAHKSQVRAMAHRALGWVEWKRGNRDAAYREMLNCLAADPQRAEVSGWLGALLAPDRAPERQIEAIWHLARAAYLTGDGALPTAERKGVRALLEAAYAGYHGALDGLDDVGAATKAGAVPPGNFFIESAAEVEERLWTQRVLSSSPGLGPYLQIRKQLQTAQSETLADLLKQTELPPLAGTLIACEPLPRPTEIRLALPGLEEPEFLLKLDGPAPRCPDPGTLVEFTGTPVAVADEPFLLTIEVNRRDLKVGSAPEQQ